MKIAAGALRTPLWSLALSLGIAAFTRQIEGAGAPVTPAPCPGLAELAAIGVLRTWPSLPVGALLQPINMIAQVLGTAALVWLVRHVTRSWMIAAAVALACALLPAFSLSLAVSPHVMLLAASAVLLGALTADRGAAEQARDDDVPAIAMHPDGSARGYRGKRHRGLVIGGLVATAVIQPTSTIPIAALAAWWLWRSRETSDTSRIVEISAAATCVLVCAVATVWLMPAMPRAKSGIAPCVIEPVRLASVPRLSEPLVAMLTAVGPYVIALAMLGTSAVRRRWPADGMMFAVVYVAAVALTAVLPHPDDLPLGPILELPRPLVPLLAGVWALTAVGLAEVQRAAGRGFRGHFAAALLIVLVPALQWSAHQERGPFGSAGAGLTGHAALSLQRLDALLDPLPQQALLVLEDAGVDLLLRARAAGPSTAGIGLAPRDPFALAQWLAVPGRAVYALPLAQRGLQHVGLRVTSLAGGQPLARVEPGRHCYRLRDEDWRSLPDLAGATAFGLVARREDEAGPVVLYATFDASPAVRPVDWPLPATRGFHAAVYRLADPADRARLDRDLRDDAAPATVASTAAPYVARLEQWRTPGAPFVLPTSLGAGPGVVVARLKPGASTDATASGITLCGSE
jgi:hypothetical protein